jgi:hypothetical protein
LEQELNISFAEKINVDPQRHGVVSIMALSAKKL